WLQLFAQGAEGGAEGTPAEGGQEAGLLEQQPEQQPEQPQVPKRDPLVQQHWQRVDRIYNDWMAQAKELQQLFPDFDIRRELADARFAGMLLSGVDISSAYQALHARDILPAAMEYAARTVQARLAESMRTGAYRPGENGLGGSAAALVGRNVSRMSRQDYDKVCRMVERGERVSFG
ncbi:MAG: hypothetical protein ACI3XG_05200, partial [Faecousia sp.]